MNKICNFPGYEEENKVTRKKTSLKNPNSLFGKKNTKDNLERTIEIICPSHNDQQQTIDQLKQSTTPPNYFNEKPDQAESTVGTHANECASLAKTPSSGPKKYMSKRKDKSNVVFIFILNEQKAISSDKGKSPGKNAMDVIDLSSVLNDNNYDELCNNLTENNRKCTSQDIKKLVGKVIGDLSKKGCSPQSTETNKKGHQYFLILNCPLPSTLAKYSKSKTSNKKPALKPSKKKILQSQHANTKRNVSAKGAVQKFKGGLTKRYLSDKGNKESAADQNNTDSEDNDDYADNNSIDFNNDQGSDDEIEWPLTVTLGSSPDFNKLTKAFTSVVNKKNLNKEDSETTKDEESKKKLVQCERCVKGFSNMKCLKAHQKRKSCINREAIELKKKNILLRKSRNLNKEKGTESANEEDLPLTCETCQGSFKNRKTLTNHIRTTCKRKSTGKTQGVCELICEQCGKKFHRRSRLLEHIASHENLRTFSCDQCDKGFNRSALLSKHKKTVHGKQKYQYFCSHCGLRSESKEHIEKHEQVHTLPEGVPVPTPFQCNCGKAFISKHALRYHKNTSCKQTSKIKPYTLYKSTDPVACPVCKKVCRNRMAMYMHKYNTHRKDGAQGWNCGQCGKTFKTGSGLHSHNMREHRPPELIRVRCGLCHKEFKHSSALWAHQKYVHEEGTLHRCGECGSKFKRKGDFTRHLKDRHGARPAPPAPPAPPVPDQPAPHPPVHEFPATPTIETFFGGFL